MRFVNEELIPRLIDFAERNGQSVEDTYTTTLVEMAVVACNHGMPFSRLEQMIHAAWGIAKDERGVLQ
ncbi:hypothetical protein D3C78_1872980 [compost metagenome]